MIENLKDKQLDPALFEEFDIIEGGEPNESLIRARTVMRRLTEIVISHDGKLGEPLVVGLEGMPGTGKSHLIDLAERIMISNGIKTANSKTDKYLFPQKDLEYRRADVIFSDDLFFGANTLHEAATDMNKGKYELDSLPKFLFHLYDQKKIWIVSSNFPINEILELIAKKDTVGRLRDRVEHLLASVQPLKLERKTSYRKKLASDGTRLREIFSTAVNEALLTKKQ